MDPTSEPVVAAPETYTLIVRGGDSCVFFRFKSNHPVFKVCANYWSSILELCTSLMEMPATKNVYIPDYLTNRSDFKETLLEEGHISDEELNEFLQTYNQMFCKRNKTMLVKATRPEDLHKIN